jgi:site-specific DNA recombinase
VSGAEFGDGRPGLKRLIDMLPKRRRDASAPFKVLVVSEQSRIGRDTILTMMALKQLNDAGVRVFGYLDDREIKVTGGGVELVQAFISSWSSDEERAKAGQRSRDAMLRNFEAGKSVGGRVFGYDTRDKKRTVNSAEAAVVRKIFTLRAGGAGLYRIARRLERDGIASPRTGQPRWWSTQVGAILRNPLYVGQVVWGRTRSAKRYGTSVTERSPESVQERVEEALRIVDEKLWSDVQRINQRANQACWRNAQGRLLSRPTSSKHLLSPFLACGTCGSSMHARKDRRGVLVYCCTVHKLRGRAGCTNSRGLRVEWADKFVVNAFEQALAGQVVLTLLKEALDERRRAMIDPAPLRRELAGLRVEVKRLADAIAEGADVSEVRQALADRKGRIEHLEGQLSGAGAIERVDLRGDFRERLLLVLDDWRLHLKKHPSTAQAVLRKCLPTKLRAVPEADGAWTITGPTDYRAVLNEVGYAAVLEALGAAGVIEPGAKVNQTARRSR